MTSQTRDVSIFELLSHEEEEPVDKEMYMANKQLVDAFQGKSDHEIHNFLQEGASSSMQRYAEIVNGLLFGILTVKEHANDFFRHLNFVSRDSLTFAGKQTRYFCIHHQFHRIKPISKEQLVWLVGQLTLIKHPMCDALYMNLLKQIRGGDTSPSNVQHAEAMLNLLNTHLSWVYTQPILIAYSCFTYLRIILDHTRLMPLRNAEVAYCVKLLRERFKECSEIGRDLIRALQDVSRLKEFEEIWRDLLHSPENLNPQLEGVYQLLALPSRDIFLGSRLTFDMEHKLLHILKTVNLGQHMRNTQWFYDRFLATPDADALFSDIIRYICGVYHPTNAVLASSIVPRYVIIGALIRQIKSHTTAANVKLALFYDWLFYDPSKDSIMNIEPAMLLMERSLYNREPWITAILLEFLHFAVQNYYPPLSETIHKHVGMAGQILVDKQVIKKFGTIYNNPVLSEYASVQEYIISLFPNQLAAEGISNMRLGGNTAAEHTEDQDEVHGAENDTTDRADIFESGSLHKAFDKQTASEQDDIDDTVMTGGRIKDMEKPRSRTPSRESSHEPMQLDDNASISATASTITQKNDIEESAGDEVMESAVVEPQQSTTASSKAEPPVIPNWTFPTEITGTSETTPSKDSSETYSASTPIPGASLWIFGSSLQDFKKAYEHAPDSAETAQLFRSIWEIYSDVAGTGVEGVDLANEIGQEICVFAQKASIPDNFFSNPTESESGVMEALMTCLRRVVEREGRDGALRVVQMFTRSEANVAVQDRFLGMWYLIGLVQWWLQQESSGATKSLGMEQVLDLYGSYLKDSAMQEQVRSESKSEDDEENGQTTLEMAQSYLARDLEHLQERHLGAFDMVLPLVLRYLPDLAPRNERFLRLILSMATPVQIHGLSDALSRRDFVLLSTPVSLTSATTGSKDKKTQGAKSRTKSGALTQADIAFTTFKDTLSGDWEPKLSQSAVDVIGRTIDWEVYEQMGVWQLLLSEVGGDSKATSKILGGGWVPGMTSTANSEALSGLLNLLRALSIAPPDLQLGKAMARIASTEDRVSKDMMRFCQSCIVRWAKSYPDHVAALLLHLSDKHVPQDQIADFSVISADADVEMEDAIPKTTRSSRSKAAGTNATKAKVKLNPKQRKQQGLLLQGILQLLKLWWLEMSEEKARTVLSGPFGRVWSQQVRNQVREALIDNFSQSYLAAWPAPWWEKGDDTNKLKLTGPRRRGSSNGGGGSSGRNRRRGGDRDEDEDEDEDEDGEEEEDDDDDGSGEEDEEKSKSEEDEEDEADIDNNNSESERESGVVGSSRAKNTRSRATKNSSSKSRKRPLSDDNEDEDEDEEQVDDEEEEDDAEGKGDGKDDDSDNGSDSSGTEKKTRTLAKDKKRIHGVAGTLSSSESSSRRNSPKAGGAQGSGVLNSRSSTRKKTSLAANTKASERRAPTTRRGRADKRKRKIISDDEDEDEEEEEEEEEEDDDDDKQDEGENDDEDEEEDEEEDGGVEGNASEGEGEDDGEDDEDKGKDSSEGSDEDKDAKDTKSLKPMLFSQRKAAASANSKLMSNGSGARGSTPSSSASSSANSSANSTPNLSSKSKSTTRNKKQQQQPQQGKKPKRRIVSDDESDE
ncbi:Integrator complex subunit 3 [Podila epigama]|nr:Integrator complex subunit 3 [Podila epigama]